MRKALNKRAEGYVDVAVAVLVISFLLILLVSVFGVIHQKQTLNQMAEQIVEIASINGCVDDEVMERYEQLCEQTGLTPTMTFEATYFDEDTGKVQLGDIIFCTLTMETSLIGFGGELFPINMTVTASGVSQVYWR
ncbi:MAG: DUF4320 family protein [Clostridia bacterium]|nr:DUF4320 family protein [Clostridia bacterium]